MNRKPSKPAAQVHRVRHPLRHESGGQPPEAILRLLAAPPEVRAADEVVAIGRSALALLRRQIAALQAALLRGGHVCCQGAASCVLLNDLAQLEAPLPEDP